MPVRNRNVSLAVPRLVGPDLDLPSGQVGVLNGDDDVPVTINVGAIFDRKAVLDKPLRRGWHGPG
jgi:hypothetical protein